MNKNKHTAKADFHCFSFNCTTRLTFLYYQRKTRRKKPWRFPRTATDVKIQAFQVLITKKNCVQKLCAVFKKELENREKTNETN